MRLNHSVLSTPLLTLSQHHPSSLPTAGLVELLSSVPAGADLNKVAQTLASTAVTVSGRRGVVNSEPIP